MGITLDEIEKTTLRIITAYAATKRQSLSSMVYKKGVEGVLLEALQNEAQALVEAGNVGQDVKDMAASNWNAVWMGISANHSAKKPPPVSIAVSLEARAAQIAAEDVAASPSPDAP